MFNPFVLVKKKKEKKKKQRKVSLDEKHKWHTKFPWWIGPFTEINWIDAKDPRGAENCSAMDENPLRAAAPTSSRAYLYYA